ncbi:MAG: hypothetical protein NUV97_02040 [archaeon]|nr:hypothetical protein [archaeon]MCR4323732.1 hypothetical protein [Nanoarchaeota archaeon]
MAMKFCKECNGLLRIAKEGKKTFLGCEKCETWEECGDDCGIVTKEHLDKKILGEGVAEKERGTEGYDFKCKKCGNNKCTVHDLGMMYGDEDYLYLLTCTKCDYSERVGDYC